MTVAWAAVLVFVVLPCVFAAGSLVGYGHGRRDAEDDLVAIIDLRERAIAEVQNALRE